MNRDGRQYKMESFKQRGICKNQDFCFPIHSCFLIGEDHLLIQCAEILIKNHFVIKGLISSFAKAQEWAKENQIKQFNSINQAKSLFNNRQIDYLFSIVNGCIIPKSIIDMTQKLAINYHHSPLPKYAGLNATCWALLNNEQTHGVTWHCINELIDGGDILKQSLFPIAPEETGLSLNQKCHQNALYLFTELINDIKNNTLSPQPQALHLRTYYELNKKPVANGFISWSESCEEIERYFRALNLGAYDNTLSTVKLMIHGHCYIVSELKASHTYSSAPPGTITEVNSSFWRISTKTKDIFLIKLSSLFGKECKLEEVMKKHQITQGFLLSHQDDTWIDSFEKLSERFMAYEAFWIDKLIHFEPAEMPFARQFPIRNNARFTKIKAIGISDEWLSKLAAMNTSHIKKSHIILTLWLIYLYRIGNKKNVGVGLHYSQIDNPQIRHIFSSELPFLINFAEKTTFKTACHLVAKHLRVVHKQHTFLKDVFYRYQAIAHTSPLIPITILFDDVLDEATAKNSSAHLILKISIKKRCIEWYVENHILDESPHLLNCIENSAEHLQVLMDAVIDMPSYSIMDLPLLSQNERKILLNAWSSTNFVYPKDKTVISVLEQAIRQHAKQPAIENEQGLVTYETLFGQVDQLANRLVTKYGIKVQQPVVVYLSRSIEWIMIALAILKIGAIYIPVARHTPINRIKLIIEDSKATALISTNTLFDTFSKRHLLNYTSIRIHDLFKALPLESKPYFLPTFSSQSIAYIMYTSGTTGSFKGVMVKHVSLINLIYAQINTLPIDSSTRILQFASIAFDASIWEIFATFMSGATLCIPSEEQVLVGKNLSKTLNQFRISMVTLPPSILQTITPEEPLFLKTIITAGESCSKELAKKWVRHVHLINAYGPTETTVCATMGVIKQQGEVTIGRPIANTKVYILDDRLNLTPIGVVGELYIGGDAVAKGYLNQPAMTEHFFISNPISLQQDDLLYRTRDLARWLPNGEIEYIGRVDHQFKIRGLQIEPEAIENQILHHPQIAQCVVCMQDTKKLNKFIVAYLVVHQQINLYQLRAYLSEHLPPYMIPSFFVILDQLPLTTNGKIDRKSLPKPKLTNHIDHDFQTPSTDTERKLCEIWTKILGIEQVGVHQDFFAIGGNSLLLSQLIVMLREQFNFEMHFSLILKNPTIARLAKLISKPFNDLIEEDYHERLLNDTQLPLEIIPSPHYKKNSNTVLLTGATGFLGIHLLKQLHAQKRFTIYCLIRAKSNKEAQRRLQQSMHNYGITILLDEYIIPIAGDLSSLHLGLSERTYKDLAKEIDEIYHNAAFVHHLYHYEQLRAVNVLATTQLLKFACLYKTKQLHYISTLSAVGHIANTQGKIIEHFLPMDAHIPPSDGYNQTKWVSEKLLATAAIRGFPITIYRPSLLLGSTWHQSKSLANNHLLSLIKSCVDMKCAPSWDVELDILPVEFVSDLIVKIASTSHFPQRVFNFSNIHRISWLDIIQFLNDCGLKIELISSEQWNDVLKKTRNTPLFNLLPLYEKEKNTAHIHLKIKSAQNDNTNTVLNFFNQSYPVINNQRLADFLYFLLPTQSDEPC